MGTLLSCSHCKALKPFSEFPPSKARNKGQWCRECFRNEARKRLGAVEREVECAHCGKAFVSAFRKAKFCSSVCKTKDKNAVEKAARDQAAQARPDRFCPHCGVCLPKTMRINARFCSEKCNSAAHHLNRAPERRGMGRRRDVQRAYVLARDGMRCHLCGGRVRPGDVHLDHVVPLSLGGAHDVSNLRVAHARCNLSKRADARNEQILLFG